MIWPSRNWADQGRRPIDQCGKAVRTALIDYRDGFRYLRFTRPVRTLARLNEILESMRQGLS